MTTTIRIYYCDYVFTNKSLDVYAIQCIPTCSIRDNLTNIDNNSVYTDPVYQRYTNSVYNLRLDNTMPIQSYEIIDYKFENNLISFNEFTTIISSRDIDIVVNKKSKTVTLYPSSNKNFIYVTDDNNYDVTCENCVDCINCKNCEYCNRCLDCESCTHCNDCISCNKCKHTESMTLCNICEYCSNCVMTKNSKYCNKCNQSMSCKYSTKVDTCKYVYYSKKCNDSDYIRYSDHVKHSKKIYKSEKVNKSENIAFSKYITNSATVIYSKYITNSLKIYYSRNLSMCNVCGYSSYMYFCYDTDFCKNSHFCFNCYYCKQCKYCFYVSYSQRCMWDDMSSYNNSCIYCYDSNHNNLCVRLQKSNYNLKINCNTLNHIFKDNELFSFYKSRKSVTLIDLKTDLYQQCLDNVMGQYIINNIINIPCTAKNINGNMRTTIILNLMNLCRSLPLLQADHIVDYEPDNRYYKIMNPFKTSTRYSDEPLRLLKSIFNINALNMFLNDHSFSINTHVRHCNNCSDIDNGGQCINCKKCNYISQCDNCSNTMSCILCRDCKYILNCDHCEHVEQCSETSYSRFLSNCEAMNNCMCATNCNHMNNQIFTFDQTPFDNYLISKDNTHINKSMIESIIDCSCGCGKRIEVVKNNSGSCLYYVYDKDNFPVYIGTQTMGYVYHEMSYQVYKKCYFKTSINVEKYFENDNYFDSKAFSDCYYNETYNRNGNRVN